MQRTVLAVLLVVVATASAVGQTDANGEIAGRIVDSQAVALPGVRITTSSTDVRREAVTDHDGRFVVGMLKLGTYRLEAELAGFASKSGTITLSPATRRAYVAWPLDIGCIADDVRVVLSAREAAPMVDAIVHVRVRSDNGSLLWSTRPECAGSVVESYAVEVLNEVVRRSGRNDGRTALQLFLPPRDARLKPGGEYLALLWPGGYTGDGLVLPIVSGRITSTVGDPLGGMRVAEALETLAQWSRERRQEVRPNIQNGVDAHVVSRKDVTEARGSFGTSLEPVLRKEIDVKEASDRLFARRFATTAATVVALLAIPALAREAAVSTETFRIAGLRAPAEIRVDRWGVPHIYARSEPDVFFAQGFNAARDRLFQIDLWRRRGLGQLAEVFGPEFVDQDRAARLFLYRGDMDREWRIYSSRNTREAEPVTQRFVEGINAYVDWLQANPGRMPWEFTFLKYQPAKWTADDVIRIRSHGLTRNLASEVARANTLCKVQDIDADQVRFGLTNDWKAQVPEGLDPCLPADILKVFQLATQDVRVTKSAATAPQASVTVEPVQLAALEEEAPEGSNSWVVGRAKSATGRPIMANDPHRAYSAPSLRYLVHLSAPGLDVIGAGEPALPGISLGHNGAIAFGLTIFNIDQEDLYVYELNSTDATQYKYKDGWESFRVVKETIAVKGAPAKTVELTFTRHGPVIHIDSAKGRAYAVRSGWLEPGMSPYFGSLEYMRAQGFSAFRKALVNWGAPTLNQVYADTKGNIGWIPSGLAPKRPNWDGLLPVPGDGHYEWDGFWRGDQMPSIYNPEKGWIATANAYNIPEGYPAKERKLGFEWTNPSRHQRLHEVLGALSKISLEDSERLQHDILSIPARRLVALLAPLTSEDEKTKRALAFLRGWDARLQADSPQAALEEIWQLRHLRKAFREAVLKPEAAAALSVTDMNVMLMGLEQPETRFGDNASAKRDQLLLTTLKSAWEEMEKLQGPEPAMWQWGKLHYNLDEHPFAPAVEDALRARINVGPIPKNGSEYTPNQSLARTTDFRQMNGPSVRLVVDVGKWDNSRAVNHPGQSGDPESQHYRDLAPLWRDGRYFPLMYTRKAVESVTERVIRLLPAR